MEVIKDLSEHIEKELDCAECYILAATKINDEYPAVAQTCYALSMNAMDNMKKLHDAAAAIITDYRKEKGEPPAPMLVIYDYLHEKHIAKAAQIKAMQSMFNGR